MIAKEQRPDVEAYLASKAGHDPFQVLPAALDFLELSDEDQQAALKVFAGERVVALTEQLVRLETTKAAVETERAEWGEKGK